MSSSSKLVTQFHVKIDGTFVPEAFMQDVFEVSVQNSLHLPDVATIILNDKKLTWIDDAHYLWPKPDSGGTEQLKVEALTG